MIARKDLKKKKKKQVRGRKIEGKLNYIHNNIEYDWMK